MILEEGSKAFLQGLNAEQEEAVLEKTGSILVMAGAGSGKTKVLTSRIVNLVSEGTSPYEILAVTFTNKAAKEMRERLAGYLGEETVRRMWVGTFHKICGIILRKDIDKYATKDGRTWSNSFVIYDDSDTKAVIKAAVKKLGLDEKIYDYKLIKTIISNAKNDMRDAHAFASGARDHKTERISEVYYEYEKQLSINNALDFDDMLLFCAQLLEQNDEVREYYSNRFKHILADEFQDTNLAQYKLIRMLFNSKKAEMAGEIGVSLCAVGDVDQSIYSWRGADFKIILNFQKDYPGTKLIKLEQNYRSSANILNAANAVILNNSERLEKNLYSQKGDGEKISLYEAQDDRCEAQYIASKIQELGKYNDVAVLYRTNAQSRSIERALYEAALPYKVVGGVKFYDRKEIKDIIAYLRVVYNPNDSQGLRRIINVPKRSIGDTTVKKISDIADEYDISMFEVIKNIEDFEKEFTPRAKGTLSGFVNLINDFILKQQSLSLSEFSAYALEQSGYMAELRSENSAEGEDRIENLQEFINLCREFEFENYGLGGDFEEDLGILGNFLSQVALVSEADKTQELSDAVTLMTLHASKGLEFPVVFLAGMEENIFPHSRALSYEAKSSDLEEERRLMYVGITRAKDVLHLTHARQRMVWGDVKCFPMSRFIEEIPEEYIEKSGETVKREDTERHSTHSSRSYGFNSSGRSFSQGFVAPSSNLASSLKQKSAFVVKKDKAKSEYENKKAENIKDIIARCKANAGSPKKTSGSEGLFSVGTRVFHPHFGVGQIKEASKDTYSVEFAKTGLKILDTFSSNLKVF